MKNKEPPKVDFSQFWMDKNGNIVPVGTIGASPPNVIGIRKDPLAFNNLPDWLQDLWREYPSVAREYEKVWKENTALKAVLAEVEKQTGQVREILRVAANNMAVLHHE